MPRRLLTLTVLALALGACRPSPERLLSQAHELADAQDWPALLAHLDEHDLSGAEVDAMRFTALARTEAWADAYAMIGEHPVAAAPGLEGSGDALPTPRPALDPELVRTVCAHHVAADPSAEGVLATCDTATGEDATGVLIDELVALQSPTYEARGADTRFERVRESPDDGVPLLAPIVEARLDAMADAAEEPIDADPFRQAAFQVRRDAERGEALITWYQAQIEASADADPQRAVTWSGRLYQPQVRGLEVPEAVSLEAEAGVRDLLFPTYLERYHARFLRKWADDEVAAGRWMPDRQVLVFEAGEGRNNAAADWVYLRFERPRPVPSPDFLGELEACADESQPCEIPFEQLARWGYDMNDLEAALAQTHGAPLEWPTPL